MVNAKTKTFPFLVKHCPMKKYLKTRGTAPHILISFTPRSLYPLERNPRFLLDRRLGGSQSQFGNCKEEKNILNLPGIELPFLSLTV
jgi:hypothetical protein